MTQVETLKTYKDFLREGFSANKRFFRTSPCRVIRNAFVGSPSTFIPKPFGSSGTLKDMP